ncbi:MAG: preprotein translocase subunit YajC [Clostridia bacterium]|nr:preprotein translocase subunit YajC [Clostridia bacterium]
MKWYYWAIVLGVLAIMYVVLIARQKKQEKQSMEIMNSFQVGDKVITHIGIYGKIKRIYNTTYGKVCVLEIGNQNKIEVEMDMRYIAGKDEKTLVADEPKKEEQVAPAKDEQPAPTEKEEPKPQEEPVEEQPKEEKPEKKTTKSKKKNK